MSTRILVTDDVDEAAGLVTIAAGKTYIGLNGEWRELDITDAHYQEMFDGLQKFWAVARPCEAPGEHGSYDSDGISGVKRYWKDFRAWADQHGVSYTPKEGSFYPRRPDVRKFDDWLRSQGRVPLTHNWKSHDATERDRQRRTA